MHQFAGDSNQHIFLSFVSVANCCYCKCDLHACKLKPFKSNVKVRTMCSFSRMPSTFKASKTQSRGSICFNPYKYIMVN